MTIYYRREVTQHEDETATTSWFAFVPYILGYTKKEISDKKTKAKLQSFYNNRTGFDGTQNLFLSICCGGIRAHHIDLPAMITTAQRQRAASEAAQLTEAIREQTRQDQPLELWELNNIHPYFKSANCCFRMFNQVAGCGNQDTRNYDPHQPGCCGSSTPMRR